MGLLCLDQIRGRASLSVGQKVWVLWWWVGEIQKMRRVNMTLLIVSLLVGLSCVLLLLLIECILMKRVVMMMVVVGIVTVMVILSLQIVVSLVVTDRRCQELIGNRVDDRAAESQ